MDGSYLFQPEVIAASRQFVCARLVTYEDPEEAVFLKAFVRTRSGEVENSSFGILAPDGKTKLVFGGRSIRDTYATPQAMADDMDKLAHRFTPKSDVAALPLAASVRIGLDVASADTQPFVAILGKDPAQRKALEADVAKLAWSPSFVGRFIYASTSDQKDLSIVDGINTASSVLVIQPDRFGLKGKVIAQTTQTKDLAATLSAGLKAFVRADKSLPLHVRDGRSLGIFWQTKVPVTDPGEAGARERTQREESR